MTKRETMTEMEISVDEKTQRKLQEIYDKITKEDLAQ